MARRVPADDDLLQIAVKMGLARPNQHQVL